VSVYGDFLLSVDTPQRSTKTEGWPSPVDGSCPENSQGDEPSWVRIPGPSPPPNEDAISPAGVGYDIACGNKAVLTDMPGGEARASIAIGVAMAGAGEFEPYKD
jgi:hypothetical protein